MSEKKTKKKKEPAAEAAKPKKKVQRATSNVFAMFGQKQIQEFKEAFTMIDQDRDGFISKEDLRNTFGSFGKEPADDVLDEMVNEAPGPINFTMFLTLFGDRVSGMEPEDTILNAFKLFDEKDKGYIDINYLKEFVCNIGEKLSKEEMKDAMKGAPLDKDGKFDYKTFVQMICRGMEEEQ